MEVPLLDEPDLEAVDLELLDDYWTMRRLLSDDPDAPLPVDRVLAYMSLGATQREELALLRAMDGAYLSNLAEIPAHRRRPNTAGLKLVERDGDESK